MATTRAALFGLALVAVLLAALAGSASAPEKAGAATLVPCEATNPPGPKVELDGQLTVGPSAATRAAWRRSGVRQTMVRPASNLLGEPTFPIQGVKYGQTSRIDLKGGIRISRGRRSVAVRSLQVFSAAGKPAQVRGTVGRRKIALFAVKGGKRAYSADTGELSQIGTARLTGTAALLLNRSLKTGRKKLRAGTVWGFFSLYSHYEVIESEDPTGEVPEAPPVKARPSGAFTVQSAAIVKWYVRDTFINYVASGEGTRVEDGATADPPSGPLNLAYSFNFPFSTGWTVPKSTNDPENTLIKGSGRVGFRYCHNTINFTASDPEIEIDGDTNSRLIFHVNGTDGTAFPDQRAVMVKLLPSQAAANSTVDNGDGTKTVSYTKIPGFIPAESTGIFAGFYPAYSPDFEGQDPRPDRFGFFSIEYTYATVP